MLVRDDIVGAPLQHPINKNSGGDSSRTVGMLAMFGSRLDAAIISRFEVPPLSGYLCRHPLLWSRTDDFTRDQLLCLTGGLLASNNYKLARRVFWSHAQRGFFCQNYMEQFANEKTGIRENKGFFGRDPLSPSHIGHLIICARLWFLYPFLLIAFPWFLADLWYFTKVAPRQEQNQIIAMAYSYRSLKLWCQWHPNWRNSIKDYWSNWRDQRELEDFLIKGIECALQK
jgi:hypothetical protein